MAAPLWLITGASNGLGLLLSLKALGAGHRVIAAMRNPAKSSDAVTSIEKAGGTILTLDMTESRDSIIQKVQDAEKQYGSVDFLVNNAGYSELGAAELFTETQVRTQMETNVFGPIYTTQAVVPGMRSRRSGTIINVSSIAGQDGLPTCGLYAGSKFALEGFSESLSKELKEFGVSVLIVEPGAFRTNFLAASKSGSIVGYEDGAVGQAARRFAIADGKQPGDPQKAVDRMFEVATGEGTAGHLKGQILRLLLGKDCFVRMQNKLDSVKHDMELCREVGTSTDIVA